VRISRYQLRKLVQEVVDNSKSSIDIQTAAGIPPDALAVPDPINPNDQFILGIKDSRVTLFHQHAEVIREIEPSTIEFWKSLKAMLKRIKDKNDQNAHNVFVDKYLSKMFPDAKINTIVRRLENLD